MNLTKEIKKAPLASGFYTICGEQGAGKTSFATAILRTDYRYWRKWRYRQGRALADDYEAKNGIELDISETLYFSNTPILLDRRKGIYTHEVDLQKLGLPNDDFEVQYFPRGSVIFIQEADVLAYCRDWDSLNEYLRALIKYVRHNLLTIIFDMQYGGDLDKALRNLTVGSYYMYESGVKRWLLFWRRQYWRFFFIRSQLNNAIKELSQLGVRFKIPVVQRGKFRVFGDVFDCYDSFSGQRYFLKDIEKVGYLYREHVKGGLTVEDINSFVVQHPLSRPVEVKKRKKSKTSL